MLPSFESVIDAVMARVFPDQPRPQVLDVDDVTRLANAMCLELQARGYTPEQLVQIMGEMMVIINHDPAVAPEKRPLAIRAVFAGFGYDAELQPDGRWYLKRPTMH